MQADVERALVVARYYRELGLSPLPSKVNDKAPDMAAYACYYGDTPVRDAVYHAASWRVPNIQIITGTKHAGPLKLLVVDLDGEEAPGVWTRMCEAHGYEPTSAWVSVTGSGGIHLYFRLPCGIPECRSGIIWGVYDTWGEDGKGTWCKHKEIRILADNALCVAPPSKHVDTGKRYQFKYGCSPAEIRLPEVAPSWLLEMPRLVTPKLAEVRTVASPARGKEALSGNHYMRREVLDAIGDQKLDLLIQWGLQAQSREPNPSGWVACFVPWREKPGQSMASGSFHFLDGTFQDRKDNSSMSFFDLAVRLQPGMFPDWRDCRDYCGDRFIGRITR